MQVCCFNTSSNLKVMTTKKLFFFPNYWLGNKQCYIYSPWTFGGTGRDLWIVAEPQKTGVTMGQKFPKYIPGISYWLNKGLYPEQRGCLISVPKKDTEKKLWTATCYCHMYLPSQSSVNRIQLCKNSSTTFSWQPMKGQRKALSAVVKGIVVGQLNRSYLLGVYWFPYLLHSPFPAILAAVAITYALPAASQARLVHYTGTY